MNAEKNEYTVQLTSIVFMKFNSTVYGAHANSFDRVHYIIYGAKYCCKFNHYIAYFVISTSWFKYSIDLRNLA